MKKTVFRGVATALITPFSESGINYEQFARLIDWQIASGVDALVVCATTGESSTLTDDEHRAAIVFAVRQAAGRVPVIAGAGSNDIAYALDLARHAGEAGADAILTVTPYYNKATQSGLVKMFTTLADASEVPLIVYNVPSRTGVNIEPKTYAALAEHDNIVGIKEANGDISQIVETMSLVRGRLDLYSGNDDQLVPLLSLGGQGVISVLSNIMPTQTREIYTRFAQADLAGAAELQCRYCALIKALFCEVNPIPVKAALAALGFCDDIVRGPLTVIEDAHRARLLTLMRAQGLKV